VIVEDLDRRAWTALRPVDAVTGRAIDEPLRIRGEGQRWRPNRRGLMVLHELRLPAARRDQFAAYEASFATPTAVAPPVSVAVMIEDPRGRWLARRATIVLPRAATSADDSLAPLFEAVDVPMYAAANAPVAAPWAVVRVSATRAAAGAGGAALLLHETGDPARALGRGQADARGEALVAAPGIAAFIPSGGPSAFVRERDAELLVVFDPTASGPPDPEVLVARVDAGVLRATVSVVIASGRETAVTVALP